MVNSKLIFSFFVSFLVIVQNKFNSISLGIFVNKENKLIQLDYDLLDSYIQSLSIEVVSKMLALYRQQVVIYIVDIEKSLQCNNVVLWQEHCHKMKGAAGSIGLKSLHAYLVLMEKSTADKTEKAQQLNELKDHNKKAIALFNAWLETHN